MKYIIQFEEGVYKAWWNGDPGRTLKKENAEVFGDIHEAQRSLDASLDANPFRMWENPLVIEVSGDNHIN